MEGNCLCLRRAGCTLSYNAYASAVHTFTLWLAINFSLSFKGTRQHLRKVIAIVQMLILMVSKLLDGVREVDSFLCNIWLRKACYISPSVFLRLVPAKSPFTLWGIFSGTMHIHELPVFWAYRERVCFIASFTLNSVWVCLFCDRSARPHAIRWRPKVN